MVYLNVLLKKLRIMLTKTQTMIRFKFSCMLLMVANVFVAAAQDYSKPISEPLVKHIYTADPSAHVFNGKIYIYPSHDIDAGEAFDDLGSHFAMEDYHVISMNDPNAEAKDNGIALHVRDV